MTLENAKDLFKKDRDSYGKARKPLTKIKLIYTSAYNKAIDDVLNLELLMPDEIENLKIK